MQEIRGKEKEGVRRKQLQEVISLTTAVTDPEETVYKTGIWAWLTFLRYERK